MSIILGRDVIGANVFHAGSGQLAGYTTGSGGVPWTAADWKAHPSAVRICQDAGATDATADILDVESGAATFADCPGWYRRAYHNYVNAARPGQRLPGFYASMSNITALVNALIGGGVTSGPRLWIAAWNAAEPADAQAVENASGPFPLCGWQYASGALFDYDVFSKQWLDDVSGAQPPPSPPPVPPAQVTRHVADGSRTWGEIAAGRSTSVRHIFATTAANLTSADEALLAIMRPRDNEPYYTSRP